jgi:hypothetical protein
MMSVAEPAAVADARRLVGGIPENGARLALGLWAREVAGAVRVAIVARRELTCPKNPACFTAAEEGLNASIVEQELEAIASDDLFTTSAPRSQHDN